MFILYAYNNIDNDDNDCDDNDDNDCDGNIRNKEKIVNVAY